MSGFIKIYRDVKKHWIYQDAEYFKVWCEMLINAAYEPSKKIINGILVELDTGEFVFGRNKWADRLGISPQRLRTLIKKMVDDDMIVNAKQYPKFTIYLVKNYAKYHQQSNQQQPITNAMPGDTANQQNNQLPTNCQPTTNQLPTTYKKLKNIKNNIYDDFFENVWLLYPKKRGKGQVSLSQKKKLYEISFDELKRCVNRYEKENAGKDRQYLMYGSTFFNSGYIDYLDKNYTEIETHDPYIKEE